MERKTQSGVLCLRQTTIQGKYVCPTKQSNSGDRVPRPKGEREILGGQAAFLACARAAEIRIPAPEGVLPLLVEQLGSYLYEESAPGWLHPNCCFFTSRLLTT